MSIISVTDYGTDNQNRKLYKIQHDNRYTIALDPKSNLLHCDTGPAVVYEDGRVLYFLNGYNVTGRDMSRTMARIWRAKKIVSDTSGSSIL